MPVAADNPVTEEGVRLGRYLFYDPILSSDGQISCASCHRQSQAFSDAPRRYSMGRAGLPTARNAMPLFNLAWYPAMFWDGHAASIEAQVLHPVRDPSEMNLPWDEAARRLQASAFYRPKFRAAFGNEVIDSLLVSKAIAQFMRTLISHDSKFDRVLAGAARLSPSEKAGFVLMNDQTKGDCLHCHSTDADALGTLRTFSNNGLDRVSAVNEFADMGLAKTTGDRRDAGRFKVPSLRNVAVTAPYMHDGRFATLKEVLRFYSDGVQLSPTIDPKMGSAHQGGVHLSDQEQSDIISFLEALTDSTFISNPAYANPFR